MRPYVKICGLTRPKDARLAVSLGATHIGAVRVSSSPRCVSLAQAKAVFEAAGAGTETVLVCGTVPLAQAIDDAVACGARAVQLYGARPDDLTAAKAAGLSLFRSLDMEESSEVLPTLEPPPTDTHPAVLDVGGGGSGRRFDWTILGRRAPRATFIAGGIRPNNVRDLLTYEPYGIDLSSGVESAPGIKDAQKLGALFDEVG